MYFTAFVFDNSFQKMDNEKEFSNSKSSQLQIDDSFNNLSATTDKDQLHSSVALTCNTDLLTQMLTITQEMELLSFDINSTIDDSREIIPILIKRLMNQEYVIQQCVS